jgi:hypothetical protein
MIIAPCGYSLTDLTVFMKVLNISMNSGQNSKGSRNIWSSQWSVLYNFQVSTVKDRLLVKSNLVSPNKLDIPENRTYTYYFTVTC